jgi:hypothetical protein
MRSPAAAFAGKESEKELAEPGVALATVCTDETTVVVRVVIVTPKVVLTPE